MWVRFINPKEPGTGSGVIINFKSSLRIFASDCNGTKVESVTKLGTDKVRVWTIRRENSNVRVSCNGEQVYDAVKVASNITNCRERWSNDFNNIKFINTSKIDTASDFYRQYTNGEYLPKFLNNQQLVVHLYII